MSKGMKSDSKSDRLVWFKDACKDSGGYFTEATQKRDTVKCEKYRGEIEYNPKTGRADVYVEEDNIERDPVASVVGVERWRVSGLNDEELVGETYISGEEVRLE